MVRFLVDIVLGNGMSTNKDIARSLRIVANKVEFNDVLEGVVHNEDGRPAGSFKTIKK